MASYKIIVTPDAENDLVELRNYIAGVLLVTVIRENAHMKSKIASYV